MDQPKGQREVDHEEWSKSDNWGGRWPFTSYFSKRDSRIFVPQLFDNRFLPRTPNFGHRWGFPALILFYAVAIIMFGVIGWLAGRGY